VSFWLGVGTGILFGWSSFIALYLGLRWVVDKYGGVP
jgi:hypothetical protein